MPTFGTASTCSLGSKHVIYASSNGSPKNTTKKPPGDALWPPGRPEAREDASTYGVIPGRVGGNSIDELSKSDSISLIETQIISENWVKAKKQNNKTKTTALNPK